MLDENLPTFYLKPGKDAHLSTIYLLQHGNNPEPAYSLRYPDPSSVDSRNRFAAALYDPYVPDIVYGEVLIIPEWTQPILSAEVIRQNGGVPPPPEPIIPTRFTIQLYNPDQQVVVKYKPKSWNSPPSWSFDMPQHSFREPTGSTLDRVQIDPAAADTTPKLRFSWRKESKLSRDLTCLLRGKTSPIPETKTKSKEPDITVSIFKSLRELTLYEPNLYRVEMEDFKGLEVVLILGAITIRDVYFASPKEAFRISRQSTASTSPVSPISNSPTATTPVANRLPPEVDMETRRLQILYGEEEKQARAQTPSLPPRRPSAPQAQNGPQRPHPRYNQAPSRMSQGGSAPYLHLPGQMSTMSLSSSVAGPQSNSTPKPLHNKRSSFFGLRRFSEDGKLAKKGSTMF
ncbi:hypothetical protein BJX76DRAFT_187301 [Aspergillus varians]